MRDSAASFLWIDDSQIEDEHDRLVAESDALRDHLQLFHQCFELLHQCLRLHVYHKDREALALLRVIARVFNSAGACLKLARAGYFQPAFAMVRDILEIEFLADLFVRDREWLRKWISLDERTKKREFKPVRVRQRLDKLDNFSDGRRAQHYELLSKHAAHVSIDGFHIISPNNMTQIGPFPSEYHLLALFQELAKHLQMASIHLLVLLEPKEPRVLTALDTLDNTLRAWRARYVESSVTSP